MIRKSKARHKRVREQLAALGEDMDKADEEDKLPKKSTKKTTKGKEKASSKPNDSASSNPKSKTNSEKNKGRCCILYL